MVNVSIKGINPSKFEELITFTFCFFFTFPSESEYYDTEHILTDSNVCERAFSRARLFMSYLRSHMAPESLELLLFLFCNRHYWANYPRIIDEAIAWEDTKKKQAAAAASAAAAIAAAAAALDNDDDDADDVDNWSPSYGYGRL